MSNKAELSVFFDLIKAGLWEQKISTFLTEKPVNYGDIYRIAEEQSVVGLVAAGLEQVSGLKVTKEEVLLFVGSALQIEQRNKAMNVFVSGLFEKMQNKGISALLVKGQGIAQCYERPLWRASGDIDLFLDNDNYNIAVDYLSSIANVVEENRIDIRHCAMQIGSWEVELHGTLRSQLGQKIENIIDNVQNDTFLNARVRAWNNGGKEILLPSPDNDVIFVFTHILQHFFIGGIGLRQLCDWCRLLWTYRTIIDLKLLDKRLSEAGLMSEWKVFASLAVNTLGMPGDAMPFYSKGYEKKADRVLRLILRSGNMGHNRDWSYREKYPKVIKKLFTLSRISWDALCQFPIFPVDAIRVWWLLVIKKGIQPALKS